MNVIQRFIGNFGQMARAQGDPAPFTAGTEGHKYSRELTWHSREKKRHKRYHAQNGDNGFEGKEYSSLPISPIETTYQERGMVGVSGFDPDRCGMFLSVSVSKISAFVVHFVVHFSARFG